jgi:hypothetical protein
VSSGLTLAVVAAYIPAMRYAKMPKHRSAYVSEIHDEQIAKKLA